MSNKEELSEELISFGSVMKHTNGADDLNEGMTIPAKGSVFNPNKPTKSPRPRVSHHVSNGA